MDDNTVNLELLRKIREERGARQIDLTNALGKSRAYYTLLERGYFKNISIETMKIIRKELKLTPEESYKIFGV